MYQYTSYLHMDFKCIVCHWMGSLNLLCVACPIHMMCTNTMNHSYSIVFAIWYADSFQMRWSGERTTHGFKFTIYCYMKHQFSTKRESNSYVVVAMVVVMVVVEVVVVVVVMVVVVVVVVVVVPSQRRYFSTTFEHYWFQFTFCISMFIPSIKNILNYCGFPFPNISINFSTFAIL